jgi:hypothetical protein
MLRTYKNGERNRSILLAYIEGHSIEQLALSHSLATTTIRGIVSVERHRVAVSPEPEYCELRGKIELADWMLAFKHPLYS